MLKKVVIVVLLSPFLLIALAYLLPASTEVSRSIVIDKPSDQVFAVVNNLKKWQAWSPWYEKDPGMEIAYEGAVSGGGSMMSWKSSHPRVGEGSQEIIESRPNELIDMELNFNNEEPARAYFKFEALDEAKTKVIWGFEKTHGKNPINRYMGLMFDTWLGPEYEKGLANMKKFLESEAQDNESIEVKTDTGRVIYLDESGKPVEAEVRNTQTETQAEQPAIPEELLQHIQEEDGPAQTKPSVKKETAKQEAEPAKPESETAKPTVKERPEEY